MAEEQPWPLKGLLCSTSKTLTVVPRFPKQKGRTDGPAYGMAQGQQPQAGTLAKRGPREPAHQLVGGGHALHVPRDLKAETRTSSRTRKVPGQPSPVGNKLSDDPQTWQSETELHAAGPSLLSPVRGGPLGPRDTERPIQTLPGQGHSSRPCYHMVPLHGEVRMTKVSDCISMETSLRCH